MHQITSFTPLKPIFLINPNSDPQNWPKSMNYTIFRPLKPQKTLKCLLLQLMSLFVDFLLNVISGNFINFPALFLAHGVFLQKKLKSQNWLIIKNARIELFNDVGNP